MKTLVLDCLIYQKNKAHGYQEYLFNIINSFYKNRSQILVDSVVIACRHDEISSFMEFSERINVRGFKINNKLQQLYIQNFLRYLLRLKNDDIILYTYNYGAIIPQCKSVLVIHDLLYLRKEYLPNRMMRLQRRVFVPISLRNAEKIIAISNFTKNDIVKYYKMDLSKIKVIYNFFNFRKYMMLSYGDNSLYIEKPFILSVSSLGKHKNTIIILKAFNEICKKLNYKLVFVGSLNKMYDACRDYYEKLDDSIKNKIIFMENISNITLGYLYQSCSFFVLPTLFEGLGMPIVEALYFNSPTLLSNIDVCREVSLNSAIYFNPEFHEELVQLIFKYKYNFPKPNIQKRISEVFSENNTSFEYINVINTI